MYQQRLTGLEIKQKVSSSLYNLQSNVTYTVMIYASTTGGGKGEPNIIMVDPLQSTLSTKSVCSIV